jgi:hypothetical protein
MRCGDEDPSKIWLSRTDYRLFGEMAKWRGASAAVCKLQEGARSVRECLIVVASLRVKRDEGGDYVYPVYGVWRGFQARARFARMNGWQSRRQLVGD